MSEATLSAAVPVAPPADDQEEAVAERFQTLPPYAKTLLRIRVPVIVCLAEKKQSVAQILQIGPGSILQFEKPCDEVLDLQVGNRLVAQGEAVKIGDHFGLRITKIVLPEERFEAIGRGAQG